MTAEGHRTGTRTFLFSDIEASSRLEQRLGTATWAALRSRHRVLLRAAFIAEGGVEQGTEGDSFFVVFDSAGAALRAAIAAQRALLAEPWPDGGDVRVRMGLHTGEATRADDDYVGIDINRAARIAAAAHGGQVVMSEVTRALIEGSLGPGVDLRDLGIHRLKDFEPIRLYDVVAAGLPSDFPTLRSGGSPLAGLPAQPTTFVGRSREIAEVRSLLESSSLVTLTGPGGTGKTRLAIAAAQAALAEFPGGVAWVGLSPIVDADLVGPAIAGALAVVDEGLRPIMDAVAERIATERVLLVLDNFEQVASAAPLVGALLRRCPALAVLVTSRGLLHLAGEHEYPVGSLPLPDAGRAADPAALASNETVALFVTRAQAVRPDFELNASNADAVVGICTRLDGLPLAIELAAARVRLLPPAAILDRLERSLGLLTGGAQDLPDRQRTLRGAVGWSHDLLEPVARTLFARLAVFAGGCSLTAAETVADPGGELGIDILDGLSALADQSLVRSTEGVGGEPRFLMLHVIREFGLEQLAASGEIEAVRDRHLAAFAALAAEAEPELIGSDSGRWLDRLEVEHDNVRVALRWALDSGQLETGLATAGRLWRFWHQRAHLGEGLAMLRELLACPGGAAMSFGRAKAVNGAGGLAYWQNDFPAAQAYYEEHLAIVRALGDRAGVAEALMNLAFMRAVARALADAFPLYEQSAELYRELGDPRGEAAALLGLGMSLSLAGRYDDALDAVKRGVERAKAGDDRFRVASALGVQARIELAIGRSVDASGLAREALALFSEVGDMSGVAMQIWDLAELALGTGRDRRALVLAEARANLSPDDASVALASGRRLAAADAVQFALSEDDEPAAASG